MGNAEEIAGFLAPFPPFDRLGRDELLRVAAGITPRSYPEGTDILIEDGPPAEELFVIRSGSIELRHQDEIVDILEPGESFGHPSLLTGMAAAFTVRAHEDTTCYLIGREAALEILGRACRGHIRCPDHARAARPHRTHRPRSAGAPHRPHCQPDKGATRTLLSGPIGA